MSETLKLQKEIFDLCLQSDDWFINQVTGDLVSKPGHGKKEIILNENSLIVKCQEKDVKCYIKRNEENSQLFIDLLFQINSKFYTGAIDFLTKELGD